MPPKARITREMVIEAAFELARSEGAEHINARCRAEAQLFHAARAVLLQHRGRAEAGCVRPRGRGPLIFGSYEHARGGKVMANADKKETTLAFLLIVIYVVLMSAADVVSAQIGIEKAVTAPLALVLTAALFIPIRAKGMAGVGITAVRGKPSAYLYFIPLAVLASVNLWNGVTMNYSTGETVLYIISMICAGFLFTIIFHRSKSLVRALSPTACLTR